MSNVINEYIQLTELAFSDPIITSAQKNPFIETLSEADRLTRAECFNDGYDLLMQLEENENLSALERGMVEGTFGYAFINAQRYEEAIDKYKLAIVYFSSVDENDKNIALSHNVTALHGITVALDRLGKNAEAIEILINELSTDDLSEYAKLMYTSSICNRIIRSCSHLQKEPTSAILVT